MPRAGDNAWKLAFPGERVGCATVMSCGARAEEARGSVVESEHGGEP